jgi:hypothetical protein
MPLLIAPARSGRQPGMSHHRRHSYPAQALMLCVCALRCGCRRCAGAGGAAVIRPLIVQFGGPDRESMLDAALLAEPFCGEPRSTDEHAPRSTDRNAPPLRPLRTDAIEINVGCPQVGDRHTPVVLATCPPPLLCLPNGMWAASSPPSPPMAPSQACARKGRFGAFLMDEPEALCAMVRGRPHPPPKRWHPLHREHRLRFH